MSLHSNVRCRTLFLWGFLLALLLMVSGCAISDDPHEGGFISGVKGLAGGGYQQRIDERERTYGQELGEQERLVAEAQALREERARVKAELRAANRRLASLEKKLRAQRARLAAKSRASASARQQLRRLDQTEARMGAVRSKLGKTSAADGGVSDLKAQSAEINADLDEIDTLVELVSEGGL